jgi:glycosyltransferase involved in cell wall biosynthesis
VQALKPLRVSIGIPTYNRRAYLIRAIESVLAQTYRNIEVIVSDNASPDDTAEHVRALSDPRIVYFRQSKNIGMIGNFNACLQTASGDLFLMLSDDDLLEPTCIERLSEPFRSGDVDSAEVGVVWCPVKILDSEGKTNYVTAAGPAREPGWSLVENNFHGVRGPRFSGVLVRRHEAVAAGGYSSEYGPLCDFGNWAQIAITHPVAICVPEPLVGYTVHQASTTSQSDGKLWQCSGERVVADLVAVLNERGEETAARRVKAAGKDNISNLLATVMMQYMGKPGWVKYWISEALRSPSYLFAPVVFRRLFKDGRKLLLLLFRS